MSVLPDVLAPGLRAVFCGTAAGTRSAIAGAYYAGPGNKFWPTLHAIGLTPRRFAPAAFMELLGLKIGLTDVSKFASGPDHAIKPTDFDVPGFRAKILVAAPGAIAFNGKKAASVVYGRSTAALGYGRGDMLPGFPPVFILPSTSGAASGHWDLAPWRAFAAYLA